MFELLVFTDATSAEAVHGMPGFQFIAHTPGATPTCESVVQQKLQHSVPVMLSPDEWLQHPPTCAYLRQDEWMYISRGRSTGATIGGRPGNQLTVTAMTQDVHDILPLRPAQLFSSTAWSFERPTSQDLDPWAAPLEISDDFDIPGLHSLIVDDRWATEALPSVLTMLEQTQAEPRVRLFIRHHDQAVVMRWVALLSRFLDAKTALGFDFRVFTDDPMRVNVAVVGAHPLIVPDLSASTAASAGINLLDLERHELSPISPSDSAKRYSQLFIDGDPYEALEMIEVGRRWGEFMDPTVASFAAELAAMPSSRGEVDAAALRASLIAINALASARQTDELEIYGDELADIVVGSGPTTSTDLLSIDSALWSSLGAGDDDLAQSLTLAGLEWAAAQPELARDWAAAVRPGVEVRWTSDESREHAAGLVASVITAGSDDQLPALFRFAKSLNTAVAEDALSSAIDRLASRWAREPELTRFAQDWVQAAAVTARLVELLDSWLSASDQGSQRLLLAGSWDWLAPSPWVIDPTRPITRWFGARQLATADSVRRAQILDAVQTTVPGSGWQVFLPTSDGLDPDEVIGWIRAHDSLDAALASEIERILASANLPSGWSQGGGAKVLHEIGKLPESPSPALRARCNDQTQILDLFARASKQRDRSSNSALDRLGSSFTGKLNALYGDWIVRTVLECNDAKSAVALAEGKGRDGVVSRFAAVLESDLRGLRSNALATAIRVLDPALGPWADAARRALDGVWDDKETASVREALIADADGGLDAEEQARLDNYLQSQSKGRLTRGVLRGAKSLFGSRENNN
jgi:hypothetical protein